MRGLARWAVLILAAAAFLPAAPAGAVFGDCADPGYRASFDDRLRDVALNCVERLRVPVNTSSGARHIRILYDPEAGRAAGSPELTEFDRAVRGSAAAMGRLGGIALENITVLLSELPSGAGSEDARRFGEIGANTNYGAGGECRVIVYLRASHGDTAAAALAHELFHCVQAANLTSAQMLTSRAGTGGGGDWWIEGSATWFAALALPDSGQIQSDAANFDRDSASVPLYRRAYTAVVFFLWLAADGSPASVLPFLRRMAESPNETEQMAAMASALSADGWLRFVTSYLDGHISHPHGTPLVFSPAEGDVWEWSSTRSRSVRLEPFVLYRGIARFQCGRWRTGSPPPETFGARAEDGASWGPLPVEFDAASGGSASYRMAAINTTRSPVTLEVRGALEAGCCGGAAERDACVVVAWRLAGGGAAEWMRRQGAPAQFSTANETITFHSDGRYVTGAFAGNAAGPLREGGRAETTVGAQANGRWSSSGGTLNLCADMQQFRGQTTFTGRDGRQVTVPVAPPRDDGTMRMRYACGGASLRTEMAIPGAPPMTSEYTRIESSETPPR